ncbi:preprotein translocase subunit SecA [Serinibacter arcticus]|uniref:Protein translocase subunit SecA n=1 Tax=Serinibacter arcticus TaxID=1655435 RepID=A0A4Z1E0Q0_9MICO|nr:preprotein translocase subunit SecA [Serinibacter arcticus]TGO04053.1 Protein export cytoplasm protein SecA ATPase RNA helicase [Serinibacter arcticus]
MASILDRVLRMGEGRILKKLHGIAAQVNTLEDSFSDLTDAELREETDVFRSRHADGESLDALLPEAFAVVREAAKRTLGQRPFDVQVMGGAALHLGNIAEMKTGEGKTITATLPAYLNAISGKGVHVVTVNDYLASYQSELMGRVYRFLGMTSAVILSGQKPEERRAHYAADITYGTNNELGFDYLRDNMAWSTDELVQRGHNFVVVDEVDSILIDEARTPLIISGPSSGDTNKWFAEFARVVRRMDREEDYEVDEKKRTVGVLEPGIEKVEDHLGIENLYESLNTPLIGFLNNAIKAKELFKRDKDYVVLKGEVLIVDEHTGRVLAGRRYNDGMHQAIEAKEGVQIKAENQTLATITLQNYFRLYDRISGMTGTAMTEAAEFQNTYEMGVVPIPTNRGMQRIDQPDLVFTTEDAKINAVVEDIVERHAAGQPVLVGTTSVEKSEVLAVRLKRQGVPHEVLNAKNHAREAAIVAMAGRKGAVTVATNMAGRGTDIMLGGNAEHLAVDALADRGLSPSETPEEYEAAWTDALEEAKASVAAEHDEVVELGGLYVLGTERHESRRIDNQLRGRSGRQGDPGESRFYLSMQDDLMRLFNSGLAERFMSSSSYPEDVPLESKIVSRGIASAQGQVEARNFEIRKNVLKYDDVLSRQRAAIYGTRRRVLEGENLEDQVEGFIDDVITDTVNSATADNDAATWDLDELWNLLKPLYPVSLTVDEIVESAGGKNRLTREALLREVLSDARLAYERREEELTSDVMRQVERRVVLSVMDRKWREHLYEMDYLKEGIGLRAMAQRDPLVEYQREGFVMFNAMNEAVKEEAVGYVFHLEVKAPEPAAVTTTTGAPVESVDVVEGAEDASGASPSEQATPADADGPAAAAPATATRTAARQAAPAPAAQLDDLGLEAPQRPSNLQYSAPSEDGSAFVSGSSRGAARRPAAAAEPGDDSADGSVNREERRRAAKQAKKR